MPTLPTGTVTLLFTDIEGSTRLLQGLGREDYGEALIEHRRLLRQAFEQHNGVELRTEGDSFFVVFERAADAIGAAAQAQRSLQGGPLQVRIGIHAGEPMLVSHEDGYVGIDVHRAARIMSAGHGGQVLLSQATRDLVGDELADDLSLRDLGEHRLKDLGAPQRLHQLVIGDLASEFPALRTLENRPTNLPVLLTPLIGRERELEETQGLLGREHVRLLTVTGPGGTGKTRLALQLAAELIDRFEHGVYVVALAPIAGPELVLPTVAQALKLREQPGVPIAETIADYLQQKETLLLLDNFEHVLEAAPRLSQLLARAPRLKLVVTSRAPLHLSNERQYPLGPLPEPDAVTLFVERVQAVKPSFDLTGENEPAVRQICERLDTLPLALELAAPRIAILPPQALLERLAQRLPLLTGGARDLDERQRTLRATIEWSYELLGEQEQALFRHLSVFAGGWTLEAAEEICGGGIDVFEGLTSLVEQNLVRQRDQDDGQPRLSMLETIREYALERLEACGELALTRGRHADYFAALAEAAEPSLTGQDQLEWFRRLDAELNNLRGSLRWMVANRRADSALRQTTALWTFWDARGYLSEGSGALLAALAIGDGAPSTLRARALARAGFLRVTEGAVDEAARLSEEADSMAASAGSDAERALARATLCWLAVIRRNHAESLRQGEDAVAFARKAGDGLALLHALTVLGIARMEAGDLDEAEIVLGEGLSLCRERGDRGYLTAIMLNNLGELVLLRGDYSRAIELCQEAKRLSRRLDLPRAASDALKTIGHGAFALGDSVRAATALREGLEALRRTRERWEAVQFLPVVAALAAEQGLVQRAAVITGSVEALLDALGAELTSAAKPLAARVADEGEELGAEAFETAKREGRAMSFEDALEYALTTVEQVRELSAAKIG